MQEEWNELKAEIEKGDQDAMEAEFGDLLFSLINYARFLKINPDTALERTNQKFTKRFVIWQAKPEIPHEMTLAEMDVFGKRRRSSKLTLAFLQTKMKAFTGIRTFSIFPHFFKNKVF